MRLALLLLLGLLAGCTPQPAPELFTLAAVPGATHAAPAGGLQVRRIGLAGYLDRDDIVRSAAGYRLTVTTGQRWAEPLGRMLDRVLTEDLAQRLPAMAVVAESGAIGGLPGLVLEVNVQRLDADANGEVVLLAQVALRRDGGRAPPATRTLRLTARPAAAGTADLVAAMSALLGQLADAVAGMAAS
ncbi:MAG: hypothetical protein BGP12_05265 [Rhodospirillales bacterium 70-18]|nr:membrane integrity-associated transporter subunit PqiC [Rhodospirillales bacterium]OJY76859.1 MAG: hypothetical protein BGP12_05265 [Rhodospirillales bacterium 70-18]